MNRPAGLFHILIRSVCFAVVGISCTGSTLAARKPLPDADAQAKNLAVIREIYADEYASAKTPEAQRKLAQTLLTAGIETVDADGQYVLLRVARDMAAKASDDDLVVKAIDEIAARFEVDTLQMKNDTLLRMSKKARSADVRQRIAEKGFALLEEALKAENISAAEKLADAWGPSIRRTRDKDLIARFTATSKRIDNLKKDYADIQDALKKLESNPTDPAANLTVGRFRCLAKQQWDQGLPNLALGSDETLKDLATRELSGPQEAAAQAKLADAWWSWAGTQESPTATSAKARAAHWYEQALPGLTGLVRKKALKRIEEAPAAVATSTQGLIAVPMVDAKRSLALRLPGHEGSVTELCFSPDGKYLASGDTLGNIKIWQVRTGRELHSIAAHPKAEPPQYIRALNFSSDSRMLASYGDDKFFGIWDPRTGKSRQRMPYQEMVHELHFVKKNSQLLTKSFYKIVLLDLATGATKDSPIPVSSFSRFSHDGQMVATATRNGQPTLWDVAQNRQVRAFEGLTERSARCSVSDDLRYYAAIPYRGNSPDLFIWDAKSGERLHTLLEKRTYIDNVTFSPDSRFVAVNGNGGTIRLGGRSEPSSFTIWDLKAGQAIPIHHREENNGGCLALTFSPDGRYCATGGDGKVIHIWKLPDPAEG